MMIIDKKALGQWGAIIVSVLTLAIFVVVLIVALRAKDTAMLQILVGAAVANAGAAVQYWLGSSNGSAQKSELLAAAQPPVAAAKLPGA